MATKKDNMRSFSTKSYKAAIEKVINGTNFSVVDDDKTMHFHNGQLCRLFDKPAIEYANGQFEWWVDGIRHRGNGPAVIKPNGQLEWWVEGRRHREDGPALIKAQGGTEWYFEDKLHREDGPAVEGVYGNKLYYFHGVKHRIDGPAVEEWGSQEWWVGGNLHRIEGPAIVRQNGFSSWFFHGRYIKTVHDWVDILYKHKLINKEQAMTMKLKYFPETKMDEYKDDIKLG